MQQGAESLDLTIVTNLETLFFEVSAENTVKAGVHSNLLWRKALEKQADVALVEWGGESHTYLLTHTLTHTHTNNNNTNNNKKKKNNNTHT